MVISSCCQGDHPWESCTSQWGLLCKLRFRREIPRGSDGDGIDLEEDISDKPVDDLFLAMAVTLDDPRDRLFIPFGDIRIIPPPAPNCFFACREGSIRGLGACASACLVAGNLRFKALAARARAIPC